MAIEFYLLYLNFMCKALKKVLSFALPVIGNIITPGIGGVLGGAAAGALNGGGLKGAAIGGLTGFAGNVIGDELGGVIGSGIGQSAANTTFGSVIGDSLGQTVAGTTFGSALGNFAGNQIASGVISNLLPTKQQSPDNSSLSPTPFSPSNNPNLQLPGSLSGLSNLTPDQQTSNLATQGVYGGGLGPQEQQYFTGLVNNQLVDSSGKVADQSTLSPIDNSYLSQLGFGGYSNSNDLLGAISKWQKNQATTS